MTTAVVLGPSAQDSFAMNIAAGLRALGVLTEVLDPFAGFAGTGTMRAYTRYGALVRQLIAHSTSVEDLLVNRLIERQLLELDPLLVISVYGYFSPNQVDRFRGRTPNAKWVMWYPDAIVNLGAARCMLAPYDHLFFKEPYLVDTLASRTNLSVHYLAQACNPDIHRPEEPRTEDEERRYSCDVAVAGNLYPYRLLVLSELPEEVNLKVYGQFESQPWKGFDKVRKAHTGLYVSGRSKSLAFRGARIVLNTMHYAELQGVNSRLFEATGCGGFVLSHSSPGLGRYFELDREVVTFETGADLRDRVHYYLANDTERRKIAAAGSARTHRDHTYKNRLIELARVVGVRDEQRFGALAAGP